MARDRRQKTSNRRVIARDMVYVRYWLSVTVAGRPLDRGQVTKVSTQSGHRSLEVAVLLIVYSADGGSVTLPGYGSAWNAMLDDLMYARSAVSHLPGMGPTMPDALWRRMPLGGCSSFRVLDNYDGALSPLLGLGTTEYTREVTSGLVWDDLASFMGSDEELSRATTLRNVEGEVEFPSDAPVPQFVVRDDEGSLVGWDIEAGGTARYSAAPVPVVIGELPGEGAFLNLDAHANAVEKWLNGRELYLGVGLGATAGSAHAHDGEVWLDGTVVGRRDAMLAHFDGLAYEAVDAVHGSRHGKTRLRKATRAPTPSANIGNIKAAVGAP